MSTHSLLRHYSTCEFCMYFFVLFTQSGNIHFYISENVYQTIDFSFGSKVFVNNDNSRVFQYAITRFKVAFFIPQYIIRLCKDVLQLMQKLSSIFYLHR